MKPVIIKKFNNSMIDFEDINENSEIVSAFSDFSILESDRICFAVGATEIKEKLISRTPFYSA